VPHQQTEASRISAEVHTLACDPMPHHTTSAVKLKKYKFIFIKILRMNTESILNKMWCVVNSEIKKCSAAYQQHFHWQQINQYKSFVF